MANATGPTVSPPQKGDGQEAATQPGASGGGEAETQARLDSLGNELAKLRSEYIQGRQASGIEVQWLEDEEFYQGIDDANRNEHSNSWRTKPPGQYQASPKTQTRSSVFPNITRAYCDAGAARFADMVLPTDDRNYAIGPTPVPDLMDLSKGKVPRNILATAAKAQDQQGITALIDDYISKAADIVADAKKKADAAQTQIMDWHIEGQYLAEVRKTVEDSGRIGSGVLKGPVPMSTRSVAIKNGELIIEDKIIPRSVWIDTWNFYPDPHCGENIQNGAGTFERDYMTRRKMRRLKRMKGYIAAQIDAALKEGPMRAIALDPKEPLTYTSAATDTRFEVWHWYGELSREMLEAAGCQCPDDKPDSPVQDFAANVVMVNNRVIKATINVLDTGEFPYDVFPWQRKDGMPWGNGIARQGRTAQRITTAAVRNMMDNGGLSAGFQMVMKQGVITPADGQWEVTARKIWEMGEDGDIDDVAKAMHFFEIPSRQAELMEITTFGMKLMEDTTGLPMLLQGQQGKAPDTVGGMTLLNNNASAVLRRLARTFDDRMTEPHIRRYYAYLMQYGDDALKGDFQIDARGSSALVERDLQAQEITSMGNMVTNPMFGLDPKKWAVEWLKSRKFNPKNYEYDDMEWQKIVAALAMQAKKAPAGQAAVDVANIRVKGAADLLAMEQKFNQAESEKDRRVEIMVNMVKERIEEIRDQGAKEISFEELKAMLADTAMKLSTQRDLSAFNATVDLHKHHNPVPKLVAAPITPPTEPAGRAPAGQAYAA